MPNPRQASRRRRTAQLRTAGRGAAARRSTPRSGASSCTRSRTPRCRRRSTTCRPTAARILRTESDVEIRLAGDFIFVNATRLRLELDNYASFSHILAQFRAFEIGVIRVHPGVDRREWQIFLSLLLSLSGAVGAEERLRGACGAASTRARSRTSRSSRRSPATRTSRTQEQAEGGRQAHLCAGRGGHRDVITSVRMGRATSVKKVKRAVQMIVDQVLNNETSIVGLTTIRDYDEYTFTHSVNVCIFSVALGKKLGLSRLQLYDLGMTALLHDVGKARVPLDDPEQDDEPGRRGVAHDAGAPVARRADAVRPAGLRRDSLPVDPRGPRAPHEDRSDRLSQDRSVRRQLGILFPNRGGRRRLRRRDDAAQLPDDPDRARPGAAGDVGEPEARATT